MSHWTDRLFKEQADSYAQFFDRRFESAKNDVADLRSLLDDERDLDPQRALDIACGTGRHVIAFAETGRTAEGLDEFDGPFDLVTCFWNSLGYYDKDTDVAMLSEIERLLDDGGAVLLEVGNKEFYVRELKSSSVREGDGSLHVERREFDVEMCEQAGFDSVDLFGSLDGEDITIESPSTFVLAS